MSHHAVRLAALPLVLALTAAAVVPEPVTAEQVRGLSVGGGAAPASPFADLPDGRVVDGALRQGWRERDGRRVVGIELRLAPGWKTYWRAPGDAGIPPSFDWSGSRNVASVRILWPAPTVFETGGMRSIGYTGDVVLPVEIVPQDPALPVQLRAGLDMGVCREVCVPAELDFDATVEGEGAADGVIRAALRDRPQTAAEAGLRDLTCTVEPLRDGLRVTAAMRLPSPAGSSGRGAETVVIEPPEPHVWVSEAVVERRGERLTAAAEMVPPSGAPFALDRSGITVTVIGPRGVVEHRGCPAP